MTWLFLTALSMAIAFSVALFGFITSRRFVENRLRYVDAAQSPFAPFLAGGAATIIAALAFSIIPFVGLGTAIAFGVGVFSGVASGGRENRRRLGAG